MPNNKFWNHAYHIETNPRLPPYFYNEDLNMEGKKIINVGTPIDPGDVTNKAFLIKRINKAIKDFKLATLEERVKSEVLINMKEKLKEYIDKDKLEEEMDKLEKEWIEDDKTSEEKITKNITTDIEKIETNLKKIVDEKHQSAVQLFIDKLKQDLALTVAARNRKIEKLEQRINNIAPILVYEVYAEKGFKGTMTEILQSLQTLDLTDNIYVFVSKDSMWRLPIWFVGGRPPTPTLTLRNQGDYYLKFYFKYKIIKGKAKQNTGVIDFILEKNKIQPHIPFNPLKPSTPIGGSYIISAIRVFFAEESGVITFKIDEKDTIELQLIDRAYIKIYYKP